MKLCFCILLFSVSRFYPPTHLFRLHNSKGNFILVYPCPCTLYTHKNTGALVLQSEASREEMRPSWKANAAFLLFSFLLSLESSSQRRFGFPYPVLFHLLVVRASPKSFMSTFLFAFRFLPMRPHGFPDFCAFFLVRLFAPHLFSLHPPQLFAFSPVFLIFCVFFLVCTVSYLRLGCFLLSFFFLFLCVYFFRATQFTSS